MRTRGSYSRRFKSRKIRSSAERTAPPRSTHVQPGDVSSFLIQQGRGEVEGELRQHDGVVVELVVFLQGFAKLYGGGGGVGEGEGCARKRVRQPSHLPSIYRGKGEGGRPPPDGSRGGRRPRGGGLPPKPRGAPPLGFPLNPRRMGPRGVWRPAHLGAGSPPYSAHRALRDRWTPETLSVV